jgi:hypothetical protein
MRLSIELIIQSQPPAMRFGFLYMQAMVGSSFVGKAPKIY